MTDLSSEYRRAAAARHRSPAAAPAVLAFDVVVRRVERIGANFQRVTFGGACLRDFGVQGDTLDLRIKLIIPPPEGTRTRELDLRALMEDTDGRPGWYQRWLALDPEDRGSMRTYTVRESRCDRPEPEIDIDFVLHFDAAGRGGPASHWAASVLPGGRVWLIGPNLQAANCATAGAYGGIEWRPGVAQRILLAGDETAVPAISSILEALPADVSGHAFLEVADPADFQDIATDSAVEITWLARHDRPRGELLDAVVRRAVPVPAWVSLAAPFNAEADADSPAARSLAAAAAGPEPEEVNIDETILWETPQRLQASALAVSRNPHRPSGVLPFYAWIAGEAALVRGLRGYLVRDVGVDRKQVAFMGYWRRGRAELA